MTDAATADRIQFAFTILFHYLFPITTMGLAPIIVFFQTMHLRTGQVKYSKAAQFWARIFAVNFAAGVVTGIPMEFQFGTNWAAFSNFAGGVVGQTLAMEGIFAFFLESGFLGLFLFGEGRISPVLHWLSGVPAGAWRVALRLLHHRNRCLDAAPCWLHPVGRPRASDQSLGASGEPIRAGGSTSTSSTAHWSRGWCWSPRSGRIYLLANRERDFEVARLCRRRWGGGGRHLLDHAGFSHRRRERAERGAVSAVEAGRVRGALHLELQCAACDPRASHRPSSTSCSILSRCPACSAS